MYYCVVPSTGNIQMDQTASSFPKLQVYLKKQTCEQLAIKFTSEGNLSVK